MDPNGDDNQLVVSYLILRRSVGILGVLLPVVLAIGAVSLGSNTGFQESISHYYDTGMRGVLVGVLFAIGVFLYSYVGYEPESDKKAFEPSDNIAGNLAGVFAVGVALFPYSGGGAVGTIHFLSATGLFLTLAYFSLRLFTKTGDPNPKKRKRTRNKVYVVCGWFILACIALIAIYNWLLQDTSIAEIKPVFWLESLALWAFGWAWIVKGEWLRLLNDTD